MKLSLSQFIAALIALSLALLALVFLVSRQMELSYGTFMRDPSTQFDFHPFSGLISNVGVLGWCITAAVCIFTWQVLLQVQKRQETSYFLLYFGLLSGLLLLDDFFLFHESVIWRKWFHISEKVFFGTYGLLFLFGMAYWRKKILNSTPYPILFLAFAFFASSVFIDLVQDTAWVQQHLGEERILLEDGFKFLGIVTWLGYFTSVAIRELTDALSTGAEKPTLPNKGNGRSAG